MLKNYTEKEEITCLVHDAHWKKGKDEENSFWWSGQISSNWFRAFVLNGFEIPKLSRDYGDSLHEFIILPSHSTGFYWLKLSVSDDKRLMS